MIQTEGIFVGGSAISAPIIGEDFNWSGGDGTYQVLDDGGGNWRIKFLSSGTFTPLKNMVIDAFLVGAGGGAGSSYCGAGGAGYTTTVRSVVLTANTAYSIVVGAAGTNGNPSSAGGETTAFTDGGDGTSSATTGGKGQGTTTREFGEADGTLYASGGGSNLTATVSNSGNGGRNGITSIAPADGIVVIRQHKEVAA